MNRDELLTMLGKGVVRLSFTKKSDGTTRVMRCSNHPDIMPPPPPPNPDATKPARKLPEHLVLTWDIEAGALRSFDPSTITDGPYLLEEL